MWQASQRGHWGITLKASILGYENYRWGKARQGRATQSKLRKTNLTLLKHNIFISDSFDIIKDNERPPEGALIKKKRWTLVGLAR